MQCLCSFTQILETAVHLNANCLNKIQKFRIVFHDIRCLSKIWSELEPEPVKNGRISGKPEPDIRYIPIGT